ncbi:hypothetical protein Tco_0721364 [Tanacetum coccineum]
MLLRRTLIMLVILDDVQQVFEMECVTIEILMNLLGSRLRLVHFGFSTRRLEHIATYSISTISEGECLPGEKPSKTNQFLRNLHVELHHIEQVLEELLFSQCIVCTESLKDAMDLSLESRCFHVAFEVDPSFRIIVL